MLKYVQGLILGQKEDSSKLVEDAYKTLQQAEEEDAPEEEPEEEVDEKYQVIHGTGTITKTGNNTYEIDNDYSFTSEDLYSVGMQVSFTLYKDSNKVTNVKELVDEWGDSTAPKSAAWFKKNVAVQVVDICGRKLIVEPGHIEVDLNETKSEFIPVKGDYLSLECKAEIDENAQNLHGKIIEVIMISPVREQVKEGSIQKFYENDYTGVINKDIFFNKEALLNGYIPKVGDRVVAAIIESDQYQKGCVWRALRVLLQNAVNSSNSHSFNNLNKLPVYEHSLSGVKISDNVVITANKFKESHPFQLNLINQKYEDLVLKTINIEGSMHQTKLQGPRIKDLVIGPSQTVTFNFITVAKSSGRSAEYILFHFDKVIVGRVVTIKLEAGVPNMPINKNGGVQRDKQYASMRNLLAQPSRPRIRGEAMRQAPRFMAKLYDFRIPLVLRTLYFKYNDLQEQRENLLEELVRERPCLVDTISPTNYEDRLHTLLFLEELHHILCMRRYDLERACFITDGEYLILEMPGLAESRPSVIVGDKVIATCLVNKIDYEGFVHRSMGNHLKLKFSAIFHQQYKGEDYKIHVESSRTYFKREHQGVFIAKKLLGELLFPTRVFKKPPQVKFTYEPYEDNICSFDSKIQEAPSDSLLSKSEKTVSKRKNLINKMKSVSTPEVTTKSQSDDKTKDVKEKPVGTKLLLYPAKAHKHYERKYDFKLDWYDQSLNFYQKEAVRNILIGESRPLPYIIFGPPGTGKTVTVIECILQLLRMVTHSRMLIATPSNSAANLLTMRLINSGCLIPGDLVRLASYKSIQEESIPPSVLPYCATASIAREGTIAEENFVNDKGYVSDLTKSSIGRHRITIGTCNTLGVLQYANFERGHFTHVIVDEAGQCTEPEIMIPLSYADATDGQIIIAGDPMQLGPVVLSDYAKRFGLEDTYMDRLINRFPYSRDPTGFPNTGGYDPRLVTLLLYNYRALPELLTIPSSTFYHNELRPTISEIDSEEAEFVAKLAEMLPVVDGRVPSLVFHGINGMSQRGDDYPSWFNPDEAAQVFYYINELYRLGAKKNEIGIITPYIKQVRQIRESLNEAGLDVPKIGTVEEFQGLEFKVIVLSTVRTCGADLNFDKRYVLGFISNPRRFNVALTRSQCLTIVIGNPTLLQSDRYWSTVLTYCRSRGTYVGCEIR